MKPRQPTTGVERARLLTVVSAWYTLARLEQSGTSFDAFLELASSGDQASKARAAEIWGELVIRLAKITAQELEQWPEAVLSDEAKEFIEALVVGGLSST